MEPLRSTSNWEEFLPSIRRLHRGSYSFFPIRSLYWENSKFFQQFYILKRETLAQGMKDMAHVQEQAKSHILRPLSNRVLVRRLEAEETIKGGIILPDTAKKKQEMAKVIAIGPGKKDGNGNLIPMPVKVGEVVLIDKYSGQEVKLHDEEYVIIRADDIIAIVE